MFVYVSYATEDCMPLALAAQYGCPFSVEHVLSHDGHPFNELADSLATDASRRTLMCLPLYLLDGIMRSWSDIDWFWILSADSKTRGQFPPIWGGSSFMSTRVFPGT